MKTSIKIREIYEDESLDCAYALIDLKVEKNNNRPIESSFYLSLPFGYEGRYEACAIDAIEKDIDKYLNLVNVEDMRPQVIGLIEQYLFSDEFAYYEMYEDEKERNTVLKMLEEDLPSDHSDKYEAYDEDGPEILLYGDFITIFNYSKMEEAIEKLKNHYLNEEGEGLE